ncbi:MAG: aminotransferase class I/II-fold pyridoxal phosphate-dependent enzyme [Chloroflexia bacterium]|nr:aminotransferase class I/II-fold pyridoxal phosphate-dependent enzyme [Chloroflexia bacterium]
MKIERFELERWMTRWELEVDYDICESGILPMSLGELCSLIDPAAASELERQVMTMPQAYSEARGTLALRSALAESYTDVTPDDILVTTGAIEANFLIFNALLNPGDHVVAVSPAYQQLHSVPRAIGTEVDLWDVVADGGGFAYDVDRLEALVRPDTRLIVINTPHNPTGAILDSAQLDRVLDLARERDTWVLSDEAYRWLEHPGGEKLVEPARNRYEKAVSVGTMSKPFGMPGLRIGWFAANQELANRAWSLRDYISLSPSKISDAVAKVAIEHREAILPRNGKIMRENLDFARTWFAVHADLASWSEPKAALLAMMKYTAPVDSTILADRLAKEARVMLAPGSAFGLEGYLRIGIGQRQDLFAEGLRRTGDFLEGLR